MTTKETTNGVTTKTEKNELGMKITNWIFYYIIPVIMMVIIALGGRAIASK